MRVSPERFGGGLRVLDDDRIGIRFRTGPACGLVGMSRSAILLAGAAAMLPTAVLSEPVATAETRQDFSAPDQPVVLTRTLRRAMPDGRELILRRSYSVRFTRENGGYLVEGELVSSEVDAPPALRALAELERNRPEKNLFPIRLDSQGRMLPSAPKAAAQDTAQGRSLVRSGLDASRLSAEEKSQAMAFVQTLLAQGGAMTSWPADLFNPRPGARKETRQIAIPGGGSGQITVSTNAHLADNGRLLDRVDRVVVTELGESRRTVSESWTLQLPNARF